MINTRDPRKMTPSEMVTYIDNLHTEIKSMDKSARQNMLADTWSSPEIEGRFGKKEDLLEVMQVGDVIEATSFKAIGGVFVVKINEHRFDEYDNRITAEGMAMLHRKD